VVYGPDNVYSTCVTFGEAELPGAELLRRTGLRVVSWVLPGQGEAICKIGSTGCDFPGVECFCQCLSTPCRYWSYWYWQNGQWVYSGRGAGNRMVRDGGLDAWVWGDGNSQPPAIGSGSLCRGIPPEPAAPTATGAPQKAYPGPTESAAPTRSSQRTRMPSATVSKARSREASTPSNPVTVTPPAATSTAPGNYPGEATRAPAVVSPTSQASQAAYPQATQAVVAPTPSSASTAAYSMGEEVGSLAATTPTPDTVAMNSAVAENQATSVAASPQQDSALGSYGAFGVLTVLLLALIGYAAFVRRRRQRPPADHGNRVLIRAPRWRGRGGGRTHSRRL
jgi:hypothetical protein